MAALNSSDEGISESAEVRTEDIFAARAWLRRFGGPLLDLFAEALPFEREQISVAVIAGMIATGARFSWLTRRAAYFDLRSRREVEPREVRRLLDLALDRGAVAARTETIALRQPRADLIAWELGMRQHVKSSQVGARILANGGVRRMSVASLAEASETVREQYGYLSRFAVQIETGQQPVDGRAVVRAEAYLQAARASYMRSRADIALSVGYNQRQNIRYPGDSCEGCVAMTAKGWTAIDDPEYLPIGARPCLYNCRCDEVFRNSATGEVDHIPSSYAQTEAA